jgi:hypothetical protein
MKKQSHRTIFSEQGSLKLKVFILLIPMILLFGIGRFTSVNAQTETNTNTNTTKKEDPAKKEDPSKPADPTKKEDPAKPSDPTKKDESNKPANPATPAPVLPSLSEVKVIDVIGPYKDNTHRAGIRDKITVAVENLKNLLNYAECMSMEDKPVPGCTKRELALFLNGREIKNTTHEEVKLGTVNADPANNIAPQGTVAFHLQRGLDSDEAWADLLGNPPFTDFFDKKPVTVSVGLKDSYALGSSFNTFTLARANNDFWFWSSVLLLILLVLAVLYLALYTNLLRDVGLSPASWEIDKNAWVVSGKAKRKPYSLARTQMAFWFILVVGAFLFIWLVTGASDTITSTTLALIGIGAGTALGAAVIDISKTKDEGNKAEALRQEEKDLQEQIIALNSKITTPPTGADVPQLEQELAAKTARLGEVQREISSKTKYTEGFLSDIMTDPEGGISFHRFQMFVWTLILGMLFLYSVWHRLSMPEFGGTLLALLGISAGTYLGFKIPENTPPPK